MNRWRGSFFLVGALITIPLLPAANGSSTALESATVSELKNEVSYQAADGSERAAKVEDVVQGRDVVKTGGSSMAELEFPDGTLTRLGSHSAFTFSPESREVQTRSGLSVFFIPKGMGGLRVVSHAVVGAVEGCTVVIEEIERRQGDTTQNWTKFLLVEGTRARLWLPDGSDNVSLRAGQGIFQREGASTLSPPFDFDVKALTENATIFTGFHRPWHGLGRHQRGHRETIPRVEGREDGAYVLLLDRPRHAARDAARPISRAPDSRDADAAVQRFGIAGRPAPS